MFCNLQPTPTLFGPFAIYSISKFGIQEAVATKKDK
jgi:hypothetical protein